MSFPSPGDLPNLGTEIMSPALAGGFITTEQPGKPGMFYRYLLKPSGLMSFKATVALWIFCLDD